MTSKEQTKTNTQANFVEREYKEVPGGVLDDLGFYMTPNGSKNKSN